jgi:hypothetical protein
MTKTKTKTKMKARSTSTIATTTLTLLADGEKAALFTLRTVLPTVGLDVTAFAILMVHDSAAEFLGKYFEIRALPNGPWSFAVAPMPETIAFAANDRVEVPPDKALIVVAARDKAIVHMLGVEELLPPSPPLETITGPNGKPMVALRHVGLALYYGQFEGQAQRDWQAKFAAKVRGAVLAELAKPGPKRPLVDIAYDVLGGPRIERRVAEGESFAKAMQDALKALEYAPS